MFTFNKNFCTNYTLARIRFHVVESLGTFFRDFVVVFAFNKNKTKNNPRKVFTVNSSYTSS